MWAVIVPAGWFSVINPEKGVALFHFTPLPNMPGIMLSITPPVFLIGSLPDPVLAATSICHGSM